MIHLPGPALLARETLATFGSAPRSLTGEPLGECAWQLQDDQFLLRGDGEHYFHYRKGCGVTVERGAGADPAAEPLWLNGSVHAAAASINGFLPVHASAVAFAGQVFAFTGPAGAGKSTLIAELGRRGLPMVCDDTLILDLSDPEVIRCLPGHKRLKLTDEALSLTGAMREEPVGAATGKSYAVPAAGDVRDVLPLAALVFLGEAPDARFEPVTGGDRMRLLQDDHYTFRLYAAARRPSRADEFARLARFARQLDIVRFVRPRDTARFADDAALAEGYVRGTS